MSAKKTHAQFVQELKEVNSSIIVLGEYESAVTKIGVKCGKCGWFWDTKPCSLLLGRGCPECGKKKKGNALRKSNEQFLEDLRRTNNSIEALEEYTGNRNKILMRCRICGNEWKTTPHVILGGHGCPQCGMNRQRNAQRCSDEEFRQKMKKANPQIEPLDEYINNHQRMRFRCNTCSHIWTTAVYSVLAGHGCPHCAGTSTSFVEQVILQAFIMALDKESVLSRDRDLIGMELDIVVLPLKIAYEPGSWDWHKNKIKRDIIKREKCEQKGYKLYTIYTDYKQDEKPFSTNCYTTSNNLVCSNWDQTKIFVENILSDQEIELSKYQWKKLREIAIDNSRKRTQERFVKEIKAINPKIQVIGEYSDIASKVEFKCLVCGCDWSSTAGSALAGHGCPKCGTKRAAEMHRKSQEQFVSDIQKINPSVIIEGEYINTKTKIQCCCQICGNTFEMRPQNLMKGQGCPKCGRIRAAKKKRKTHDQFVDELSIKNPRIIVLGKYINCNTKIDVKCRDCGFIWGANPMRLLKGYGCNKCKTKCV